MRPSFYKRFHVFVFREVCVSRVGTSAPSARGLGIFAFPDGLARLVLRLEATTRKNAPLPKLKALTSERDLSAVPDRADGVGKRPTSNRNKPSLHISDGRFLRRRRVFPVAITSVDAPYDLNAPTTLPNPGRLLPLPTSGVRRKSEHNKILHPQPPATEDPQDSGALDAYCEP